MKHLFFFVVICFSQVLFGQETKRTGPDTADVSSIDNIINAYYATTTGPAAQRDWARYRFLFQPDAQINARVFGMSGRLQYVHGSLEEFIGQVDEYFTINGYFEREIGRSVHVYRDIAQVFSAYETKLATNQKSYHRGVKSIQLVFDQERWWIVNVLYNNESVKDPIPAEYLYKPDPQE